MIIALLLALQAPAAVPNADAVKAAVEDQLNAACSGEAEQDACGASRASVEIRALACTAAGEDEASCRYERRVTTRARGASAWEPATTRFSRDVETQMWFVDAGEAG
jgi:hypothetical protein